MKTLEKLHAKLSQKSGRKLAAHDVKVMLVTMELKRWVNAQRKSALAAKRAAAEQVNGRTLVKGKKSKGSLRNGSGNGIAAIAGHKTKRANGG